MILGNYRVYLSGNMRMRGTAVIFPASTVTVFTFVWYLGYTSFSSYSPGAIPWMVAGVFPFTSLFRYITAFFGKLFTEIPPVPSGEVV